MNRLTQADLQAVSKAFGFIFKPEDLFQIAADAEKRMTEEMGYRWSA